MKTCNPERLLEWLTTLALIATLSLVLVGGLLPLEFSGSWREGIKTALQEDKGGIPLFILKPDVHTVVERLLVFIPLGFLIHQKVIQRQQRHATAISLGLVALIPLMVEVAQAVVSARHSRVLDFMLATASGVIGVQLSIPLYQILTRPVLETGRRMLPGVLLLGNYLLICICVAAIIPASTKISGWDCSYPLLIGNELTYERPWRGKIRGVAIYPRELAADEIQGLSGVSMAEDDTAFRETVGAIALYSFVVNSEGHVLVRNRRGPPLELVDKNLEHERRQVKEGAFHIHEPILIKSAVPARTLCEAIMASHAFTIEAEIASYDLTQAGPARIVSYSRDHSHRNFTLGERRGDLVLRVRTPYNGKNGSKIQFQTQHEVLAGGWHHVIASYAGGVAKLFVDGEEAAPPLRYDDALFLGTSLSVSTALATGFLLFGMGVVSGIVFHPYPRLQATMMSIGSTGFISIMVILLMVNWLERYPSTILIGAIALLPFLGFIIYRRLRSHCAWNLS